MWGAKIARLLIDSAVLLVAGALLAGLLFRLAPGSSVDERQLDPRFSSETVARIKEHRDASRSGTARSVGWFVAAIQGDFGRSEVTGEPVASAIAERAPLTVMTVMAGAAGGLIAGISAAAAVALTQGTTTSLAGSAVSLSVLAFPSGLLALLAVYLRVPVEYAIVLAVAPRTYFYALELFGPHVRSSWMVSALASGIPVLRVLRYYLLPTVSRELGAVSGLAVLSALAVTIPAEVLTGRPGLGQLAWSSAMERDLPVVVAVTMVMVVIARAVTLLSSLPERQGDTA